MSDGGLTHEDHRSNAQGDELTLEDFYEHAPCGYLSSNSTGSIVRMNATLAGWIGRPVDDVLGDPLTALFSIGSQLYLETHVIPLLYAGQTVAEAAVELRTDDGTQPVLLGAQVHTLTADGQPGIVRWTLVDISLRRQYENDLVRLHETAQTEHRRADGLARIGARLAALADESQIAAAVCGELVGSGVVTAARLEGPSDDLRGAPLYVPDLAGRGASGHLPLIGPRGTGVGTLRVELAAMPTDAEAAYLRDAAELAARAIKRARRPAPAGPATWQMADIGNGPAWQAIVSDALTEAREHDAWTSIVLVHVALDECSRQHGAVRCDEALLALIDAWREQGTDLVSIDGHELYGAVLIGAGEQAAQVVAERARLDSSEHLQVSYGAVATRGSDEPSALLRSAERALAADHRTRYGR